LFRSRNHMRFILILASLMSFSATAGVNCLSKGYDGPQDGADLNRCRKVLIPGTEKYVDCFSRGSNGPKTRNEFNSCSKVYKKNLGRVINCFSDDVDGPQDGSELKDRKSTRL